MTTLRARLIDPVSTDRLRYLEDAILRMEGGRIAEVGPWRGQPVDRDLRPAVLMPGFVDSHVHYPQFRIVGAATGPLLSWLERSTFPEEARFADPEHSAWVAELFCQALAAAGTTLALVYGPVFPTAIDQLFATAARRGQRLIAGPVLMDRDAPAELCLPVDPALEGLRRLAERWHGLDDQLLRLAVLPRFALSCSPELMRRAGELARAEDWIVSSHLAENPEECRVARERFGTADYLQIYEEAGLVHSRSIFAHCVHLPEAAWERMAAADAIVAHCPDSNAFLGSGHMPIGPPLDRGVRITLGSDVAAGRSFRLPRTISAAHDNALATGRRLAPAQLLWWATRGAALALGEPRVGRLQPGLEADVLCLDCPEWARSAEEVLGWTLFDADAPRPLATWVRGRKLWDRAQAGPGYPWKPEAADRD